MSSVAGLNGVFGQSGYAASKAAVVSLTRSTAFEYGKTGVRINAVNPSIGKLCKGEGRFGTRK